ncbi:MAG: hypothetical protein KGJ98_12585 [Chloroflexota bacterium]|nr:hypothetical protein [Chloroflexota bacterium]
MVVVVGVDDRTVRVGVLDARNDALLDRGLGRENGVLDAVLLLLLLDL